MQELTHKVIHSDGTHQGKAVGNSPLYNHSRVCKLILFNLPSRDYAKEPHCTSDLIIPVQIKNLDKSSQKFVDFPHPVEYPKPPKPVRGVTAKGKKVEDNEGEKRKKRQDQ